MQYGEHLSDVVVVVSNSVWGLVVVAGASAMLRASWKRHVLYVRYHPLGILGSRNGVLQLAPGVRLPLKPMSPAAAASASQQSSSSSSFSFFGRGRGDNTPVRQHGEERQLSSSSSSSSGDDVERPSIAGGQAGDTTSGYASMADEEEGVGAYSYQSDTYDDDESDLSEQGSLMAATLRDEAATAAANGGMFAV
jgi:hypothetical protein